ncbi:uncharacterized protein LACBIDRAFT_335121 [Laccaria bicolor S238N-H82]|uniref:Predicted protein n=1 Tax=Laccaria bicolor (strain S238N-H82 / ATCC MYA-4686) TaxID=486041 RepID=B0E1F4_LACBS|nr:uncharacterized protein LACBIDRAFT_335121 [Laccaria bicolor S238N-H82]EDQ99298.1 predicted protein [Laccaria bicolor S238N-H82]|eukprot:XP_001890018.1 predicted protein [Laccaria bicolor S238N-H82]
MPLGGVINDERSTDSLLQRVPLTHGELDLWQNRWIIPLQQKNTMGDCNSNTNLVGEDTTVMPILYLVQERYCMSVDLLHESENKPDVLAHKIRISVYIPIPMLL